MASLKELKLRLASIRSTQKITAAMKMVSSANLHRTQALTGQTLIYANQLDTILSGLLSAECDLESPYTERRAIRRVAIVAFSSSAGLCGSFNANVWKELSAAIAAYKEKGIEVRLYPVGKKVANELRHAGEPFVADFISFDERPTYEGAVALAARLMESFLAGEVDQVELLYHHFISTATQVLTRKQYLPLALEGAEGGNATAGTDYILEPSMETLRDLLFPKLLNLTIYTTMLDTATSEHAARMMAMQTANDNANDLIQELTLQYNKTRQQAITNELLDIMGGSAAS